MLLNALRRLGACFKKENLSRNAKIKFLKMCIWIPLIAVIAVIFLISRRPNSPYPGTAVYPWACWFVIPRFTLGPADLLYLALSSGVQGKIKFSDLKNKNCFKNRLRCMKTISRIFFSKTGDRWMWNLADLKFHRSFLRFIDFIDFFWDSYILRISFSKSIRGPADLLYCGGLFSGSLGSWSSTDKLP